MIVKYLTFSWSKLVPALPNFRLLPILLPSLPSLCPAGRDMYEIENDIFFDFIFPYSWEMPLLTYSLLEDHFN